MRVLWISWKDWQHPQSGGAEVVLHELAKRQVTDGHEVTILTALYKDAPTSEKLSGINIIRLKGNRYVQPLVALLYYIRHLRNSFDLVVEVVNTAPYFSPFFSGKTKSILLYHQLARQIWFYETPLPIAIIGFVFLEPVATFLLSRSKATVIAMSESTKHDLTRFCFKPERIHIISEGIDLSPLQNLEKAKKYETPTLLSLGAMRSMKRTLDQVKAFELAKMQIPNLRLKIAGDASSKYGQKVLSYIANSPHTKDIEYLGHIANKQKVELMRKCHLLLVTSTKEGWGLVVSETNSQGTPAIVYDADGLRDSVLHGSTGIITEPSPQTMATDATILLQNHKLYNKLREAAWDWSKKINFNQNYNDFLEAIKV